jgi:hypothetical protein
MEIAALRLAMLEDLVAQPDRGMLRQPPAMAVAAFADELAGVNAVLADGAPG